MRVLVTNDDGVQSPALIVLARAVLPHADDLVVAAPHQNVSGAGTSLLGLVDGVHLRVEERSHQDLPGVTIRALEAHPALIVLLARDGAFGPPPDLVVSGINAGPNTGQAVLHSGTVGAALTAASLGIAAAAFSTTGSDLPDQPELDELVKVCVEVAQRNPRRVLNVNLPPQTPWRGIRYACLAATGAVEVRSAVSGSTLGLTVRPVDGRGAPDADTTLISDGYVTVTLIEPLVVHDASACGAVIDAEFARETSRERDAT
jgi:5'-nucleotidase